MAVFPAAGTEDMQWAFTQQARQAEAAGRDGAASRGERRPAAGVAGRRGAGEGQAQYRELAEWKDTHSSVTEPTGCECARAGRTGGGGGARPS